MTRKTLSPFSGKPETRQGFDRAGNPVFIVSPRVLTPLRAKAADELAFWAVVAAMGYGLWKLFDMPDATLWHWLGAFAGPLAAGPFLRHAVRCLLRKRSHIKLSVDEVAIESLFGGKRYDRQLPHKFSLIEHDKTRYEQDLHEYRAMEGQLKKQAIRKVRYYTESWHLSFDYLGQRNDLMTIYGRKDAQAVLARLKAIDEVLDALARKGQGTPLSPQDEWGDQPGQIPETV